MSSKKSLVDCNLTYGVRMKHPRFQSKMAFGSVIKMGDSVPRYSHEHSLLSNLDH